MNTTFWKPTTPRLSELWSRCANCMLSEPLLLMMRWHSLRMEMDLYTCRRCYQDGEVSMALRHQGWTAWDK